MRARVLPAVLALIAVTGCGPEQRHGPAPEPVDMHGWDGERLRRAVLAHCHAGLQGGMDRVAVDVIPPDGAVRMCFVTLPDRLRVQQTGQPILVLAGATAFALERDAATACDAATTDSLLALRALVDAATLGPLYRAVDCTRTADGLRLTLPDAAGWELRLQPGTLLPAQLIGPSGSFVFREHLRTATTWMARRVVAPAWGECRLQFRVADQDWGPDLFARPDPAAAAEPVAMQTPRPAEPSAPAEADERAATWIVLDDPRDWAARARLYAEHHAVLVAQDQQIAGFAGFLREAGRDLMVIPFRRREKGPALRPPAGWTLRDRPAGRVLLLFPDGADVAARIVAGRSALQRALAARDIGDAGPVIAQPYLHLQEGPPDDDRLRVAKVRMTVALP